MKLLIPSSWILTRKIAEAEAAFEADREQALLAKEARAEERAIRALVNEVKAVSLRRRWGP